MSENAANPAAFASQDRTPAALLGVVTALVVLNSIVTWIWLENTPGIVAFFYFGILMSEIQMASLWTALGAGSILTRAPIAAACLMLMFVAPGSIPAGFGNLERYEFVFSVIAGYVGYASATILFLILRRFTGFRLLPESNQTSDSFRITFSTKYILVLVTVFALALGLTTQLKFKVPPPAGTFIFGPDFYISVLTYGSAILAVVVLPTFSIPLMILHHRPTRRAIKWALALWVAITLAVSALTIDQSNSGDVFFAIVMAQLGATIVSALAAIWLKRKGLTLQRLPRLTASDPQAPPHPF